MSRLASSVAGDEYRRLERLRTSIITFNVSNKWHKNHKQVKLRVLLGLKCSNASCSLGRERDET